MSNSNNTPQKKHVRVGNQVLVGDNLKALRNIATRLRRFSKTPQGKALARSGSRIGAKVSRLIH